MSNEFVCIYTHTYRVEHFAKKKNGKYYWVKRYRDNGISNSIGRIVSEWDGELPGILLLRQDAHFNGIILISLDIYYFLYNMLVKHVKFKHT